jgi:hypothetical protein
MRTEILIYLLLGVLLFAAFYWYERYQHRKAQRDEPHEPQLDISHDDDPEDPHAEARELINDLRDEVKKSKNK